MIATTFAIVAVFVPIAFMSGLIGRFFFQFGLTVVAVAVLVSLFVSFTPDPMLSSVWHDAPGSRFSRVRWLERPMDRVEQGIEWIHGFYGLVLAWALADQRRRVYVPVISVVPALCHRDARLLNPRWATITNRGVVPWIAVLCLAMSLPIALLVGTEFIPEADVRTQKEIEHAIRAALHDALLQAGQVRLRPILMTTAAMLGGMLPLALGLGEGGETQRRWVEPSSAACLLRRCYAGRRIGHLQLSRPLDAMGPSQAHCAPRSARHGASARRLTCDNSSPIITDRESVDRWSGGQAVLSAGQHQHNVIVGRRSASTRSRHGTDRGESNGFRAGAL